MTWSTRAAAQPASRYRHDRRLQKGLEKRLKRTTIRLAREKYIYPLGNPYGRTNHSKEQINMKRLLALLFALALSVSMSSFAFAQAATTEKPAEKKAETKEKKEKKEKKETKAKKEKKEEKKDETKK